MASVWASLCSCSSDIFFSYISFSFIGFILFRGGSPSPLSLFTGPINYARILYSEYHPGSWILVPFRRAPGKIHQEIYLGGNNLASSPINHGFFGGLFRFFGNDLALTHQVNISARPTAPPRMKRRTAPPKWRETSPPKVCGTLQFKTIYAK